jgi:predicted porin
MAYRHTNNEGAGKDGLSKMIDGGMSQSRWGINVEEDLGGGSKALVTLENRFDADSGSSAANAPFFQLANVGLQGSYGRLTVRPSMERPVRRRDQYLRFVPLLAVHGGLQA